AYAAAKQAQDPIVASSNVVFMQGLAGDADAFATNLKSIDDPLQRALDLVGVAALRLKHHDKSAEALLLQAWHGISAAGIPAAVLPRRTEPFVLTDVGGNLVPAGTPEKARACLADAARWLPTDQPEAYIGNHARIAVHLEAAGDKSAAASQLSQAF